MGRKEKRIGKENWDKEGEEDKGDKQSHKGYGRSVLPLYIMLSIALHIHIQLLFTAIDTYYYH